MITVKGLRALQKAEVIVYDRLVNQQLLNEASPLAELIYVGKGPNMKSASQVEIEIILINKAKAGKTVVRLKGGDPFVFGRGGEECQALRENNIHYEVVPGISSALAVPAYAGIPVTQRNITTSFTVVTGHTAGHNEFGIDWDALPKAGTLVILMGVKHLPKITRAVDRIRPFPTNTRRHDSTRHDRATTHRHRYLSNDCRYCPSSWHPSHPQLQLWVKSLRLANEINWFDPQMLIKDPISEFLINRQQNKADVSTTNKELFPSPLEGGD